MNKLKTLKDIMPVCYCYQCKLDGGPVEQGKGDCTISSFDLKKEAVKWIKYFNSEEHNWKNYEPIDDWIKEFFNLTKEDLK